MSVLFRSSFLLSLPLLSAMFVTPLFAEDVATLAKAATETLRSGDLDAAIEQFDAAFSAGEPTAAMIYNKAIAHYRKGETEIARQLFAQAGDNSKLSAKARYNLGNTDYTEAVKLTEEDPNAAIGKLQSAISHYKRSLAMDRSDADARANIESAHRLMRQLQQQQEQQEQQQQNQQQDSSNQDQNQQQDQQQSGSQNQDQKSQDQTSDQTPNNTEQSEEPSEQDGSQNQEQQNDEQSKDGSEQQQPEQQQGKQEQQGAQEEQQQSEQQQQEQEQQSEQQPEGQQQKSQERPSEDPSEEQAQADSAPTESKPEQPEGELKPQNESATDTQPPTGDFKPGQRMTMQEAHKMLQAVRDRDFRRRLEKLRRMQMRRVRVEKDW